MCEAISKTNPDLREASFLRYLNCLRANEYEGAVAHLRAGIDPEKQARAGAGPDEANKGFRFGVLYVLNETDIHEVFFFC